MEKQNDKEKYQNYNNRQQLYYIYTYIELNNEENTRM